MSIYIGQNQINKIYLGSKEIGSAYLGNTQVYGPAPETTYIIKNGVIQSGVTESYRIIKNSNSQAQITITTTTDSVNSVRDYSANVTNGTGTGSTNWDTVYFKYQSPNIPANKEVYIKFPDVGIGTPIITLRNKKTLSSDGYTSYILNGWLECRLWASGTYNGFVSLYNNSSEGTDFYSPVGFSSAGVIDLLYDTSKPILIGTTQIDTTTGDGYIEFYLYRFKFDFNPTGNTFEGNIQIENIYF